MRTGLLPGFFVKLKIFQIDAFADRVFSGNPAAVCPLEKWLGDDVMQHIAMENNLAETAFYVRDGDRYQIRWFTPAVEVDLCGHATLATAYVLFFYEDHKGDVIRFFSTRSGELMVTRNEDSLTLNFPSDTISQTELSDELRECFDIAPVSAFKGKTDYMLVFRSEDDVQKAIPALDKIAKLPVRGVIITARGKNVDFVSRFFAPQSGIDEDPVTGSAHTTLTPYWAKQLGKENLTAMQLSDRQGFLWCTLLDGRVEISGKAKLYMIGEIFIE
jgi:PhzF family phenazine biosynthesis protein